MARTIVFIHGAWVTPTSWDVFRAPFDAAGYNVLTPAWPVVGDHPVAEMNANPPEGFGGLSIVRIADHLQAFIEALPEKPILLGHSFGGLLTQMLLDRGCGSAAVVLNPAPIGGIVPGPGAWRAIAPILLRPSGWNRPYKFTRERFGRLFANAAPATTVDEAYARYVIPAPGKIFHQAAFWAGTNVQPKRRTQPLLITGGTADRLISPYLSRAAYRKQSRAPGLTHYVEFPGRSHFLIAEPGWEDVAACALNWIEVLAPQPQTVAAQASDSFRLRPLAPSRSG